MAAEVHPYAQVSGRGRADSCQPGTAQIEVSMQKFDCVVWRSAWNTSIL